MKKVVIISNNSGGGHRQTARVLAQTLTPGDWCPEIVSIYRDLFSDYFQPFGIEGEKVYNRLILTREMPPLIYRLFFAGTYLILWRHQKALVTRLVDYWRQARPDVVVSVIPILNQVIAESLSRLKRHVPFVIIQTDLFEFDGSRLLIPPGTWFVSDDRTYTIVGTEIAYRQVLASYVSDQGRVFKLPGTIVDPRFLAQPAFDRAAERVKLGLAPDRPVGLFLYGGTAPNRLGQIAERLNRSESGVQYIFICGHNENLRRRLSALTTRYKKIVVGYSTHIPYYMHLSDFLIGKSGPGAIMEGVAANLPLLIDTTHQGIIHELANIDWVEQRGFGLTFDSVAQLLSRIEQITTPHLYQPLKMNVTNFEPRAVLEIPDVLASITSSTVTMRKPGLPAASPDIAQRNIPFR